uniref:PKD domain-containing protein n=1 Tax=candidate division WOR-3 bacterium TaxID=2052148 RepID=A0A7V3PTX4_UNCW3
MQKKLTVLVLLMMLVIAGIGCRNKPPAIPAKPAGPTLLNPGDTGVYQSVTTDPNRDRVLYIWDWGNGSTDTTQLLRSGDTVLVRYVWNEEGVYPVRVRAKDEKGDFSPGWSDTLLVQVMFGANRKPVVGMPIGPDSGWVGEWQRFKAVAVDPDGDSVKIKFLWDEGQTSLVSALVASGDTVVDSVRYLYRGIKNIRCVAWDQKGVLADTSPARQFYALQENTAPLVPLVKGPARGVANGPFYRFYASAVDPQGDKVRYKFIYSDGRVSDWTPLGPSGHWGVDSVQFSTLGTYYVRAIAQDSLGLNSDTSAPISFEIVEEGNILWQILIDEFVSSPALGVVNNNTGTRPALLIGGTDNRLFAFDLYQGDTLFIQVGDGTWEEFYASPAVGSDGTVYIGNKNGKLLAFTSNGTLKWTFPDTMLRDGISASVAIDGNFIYVATEGKQLYKLQDNGAGYSVLWSYNLNDEVYSSPAILPDGRVVVIDDSGYVTCLTPDGNLSWQYFIDASITSSPAVDNQGNIYFGTDQGELVAISATGGLLWTYHIPDTLNDVYSSPVIDQNGNIYFGCWDGYLYKINSSGNLEWRYQVQANATLSSSPALTADGVIYIISPVDSVTEKLVAITTASGSLLWETMLRLPVVSRRGFKPHPRRLVLDDLIPSPVIDRYGIIYGATEHGIVFAIAGRPQGTLMPADWPMFRHDVRHTGKFGNHWRR